MNWKSIDLNEQTKTFFYEDKHLFAEKTFINALKFHAPGLAPVQDDTGWYFIDTEGNELSKDRYTRAFGFYGNRASVVLGENWFHINEKGKRIASEHYKWCGNFQENLCVVQSLSGDFFHINQQGQRAYAENYRYVGDFKYGYACVTRKDGYCTHIDKKGQFLHHHWYKNLGVYHKGFAIAEDEKGWFHIHFDGNPVYAHRFQSLEPFYNGRAFAIQSDGQKVIVTESGSILPILE